MLKRISSLTRTTDKDFKEVLGHSIWALLVFALAAVMQFVFDLVLTRSFGADGTGTFYLAFSVLATIALIGRLGFDRVVVRFIPPLLAKKDWAKVKGLISATIKFSLVISIPLAVVVFIFSPVIATAIFDKPEISRYLRLISVAIPAFSLIYVYAGVLRAFKSIKESLLVERVLVFAIGAIFIFSLKMILGLDGVFWGFIVASLITTVVGYWLVKRRMPHIKKPSAFNNKVLLLTGLPLMFVMFSSQMMGQINVLFLGILSSSEAVGIFNIALKLSLTMGIILTAINSINATKISEIHARSENLELLVGKTAALALILSFPIFLLLVTAPGLILSVFGSEFIIGSSALLVLAIGQLVNATTGSVAYILAMAGHERSLAISIAFFLALNAALSWVLIPSYGILGAAIAVSVTIALNNIVLALLVKRYLNIWSLPFKTLLIWLRKI